MAGQAGKVLVSLAAMLAFVTTANAGILSASRSPMAMSRDGLLPGVLSTTNKRFGTPHVAILLTGTFIAVVMVLLSVENLVKTASTMMIVMFVLMQVAVLIMRNSGLQTYRPTFRVPLYPWAQIVAIIAYGFLIFEMGRVPLMLAGGFAVLAGLWYVGYVHWRIDREAAIVFLVKRIISRHMERGGLEDELRQISLERDVVELDRFDHLIHECAILDIPGSITAKELFRRVSDLLRDRLKIEEGRLYELFLEREKESSTVIQPGLAIPHVVVEGSDLFEIVLVRCKEGIVFSELHAPVKTAFILIGSQDERNYHLRVLMNIARIVQDSEFERRWFAARDAEQLRDIVLLTRREREKPV
jgi:mannitol/fructose-specific phosphotransferase system IIA component (Ntr-type)